MYLVGSDHPNKVRAGHLLEQLVASNERLVTNAEVLQEILHRYSRIDRRSAIGPAFQTLRGIVDEVLAIEERDLLEAKNILLETTSLSARDALHAATMKRHRVETILSFDRGFDRVDGIERIPQ